MPEDMLTTRQHLIDTAGDLFFRYGYRAIGVDTIVKESGVAKMTLYRYFPSKDDLIVAYLEQAHQTFWEWLNMAIKPYEGEPARQLEAIFTALEKLLRSPQCYGCAFLSAATEFPELDSPGHRAALAHKQAVRQRFRELAGQAGVKQPVALANQLLLLMDGAFAAVRMFGQDNPGVDVLGAARAIIEAQVSKRETSPLKGRGEDSNEEGI